MRLRILITAGLGLITAVMLAFGGPNDMPSTLIAASQYGDHSTTNYRTTEVLQTLTNGINTRLCTVIIDDGPWTISEDLTFPTNIALWVLPEARFHILTNKTLTINGDLWATHNRVFSGPGTAAGSARFFYRIPAWGDVTQYAIGDGDIKAAITNAYPDIDTNATDDAIWATTTNWVYNFVTNWVQQYVTNYVEGYVSNYYATAQSSVMIPTNGTFTAEPYKIYAVDLTGGDSTSSLPASPSAGCWVEYIDAAGHASSSTNLTIAQGGSKLIMGIDSNMVVDIPYSAFGLRFVNDTFGWRMY